MTDRLDFHAYLAYSTDGMNWTTMPLNGPEQARTILLDSDTFRIVGDNGGRYSVTFAGSPLSVTLLDFEARAIVSGAGQNSRPNWHTGTESNSDYFLIRHSSDAARWDGIGKVAAAGERAVIRSYEFTQTGPSAGANYYRLGLTDRDGQRQWSPVRQVGIGDQGNIRLIRTRPGVHFSCSSPERDLPAWSSNIVQIARTAGNDLAGTMRRSI